jgi:hypothetical protein
VLASVSFLAIVFLLESRLRRRETARPESDLDRGLDSVSICFITAFLNLIIATFLYAALSGEEVLAPRAAALGFIASISVSVAFLNLLYGVAWLFKTLTLVVPGAVTRVIATLIAPAVTFAFIAIRGLDMLSISEGRRTTTSWVGLVLLLFPVGLIVVYVAAATRGKAELAGRSLTSQTAVQATTYSALAIGVATIIATAVVSELGVSLNIPRWSVVLVMSALFVTFCAYIAVVSAVQISSEALPFRTRGS